MKPSEEWILGDTDEPSRAKQRAELAAKPRSKSAPKRARKRRGNVFSRLALFLVWFVCFAAGVVGAGFLAAGVLRDTTDTDGHAPVDLSRESSQTVVFRPWIPGRYFLYLETVDTSASDSEKAFTGRLEMVVAKPDGEAIVAEPFEPPGLNHHLNGAAEWTRLKDFYVAEPSFEPWKATITVRTSDPAFAQADSSLLVLRDRRIPGIEGLLNYEVAGPAVGMFVVALITAIGLRRSGGTWIPALLSLLGLVALGWLYRLA